MCLALEWSLLLQSLRLHEPGKRTWVVLSCNSWQMLWYVRPFRPQTWLEVLLVTGHFNIVVLTENRQQNSYVTISVALMYFQWLAMYITSNLTSCDKLIYSVLHMHVPTRTHARGECPQARCCLQLVPYISLFSIVLYSICINKSIAIYTYISLYTQLRT